MVKGLLSGVHCSGVGVQGSAVPSVVRRHGSLPVANLEPGTWNLEPRTSQ